MTAGRLDGVKAGDVLLMRRPTGDSREAPDEREATVTKVGRRYIYATAAGAELRFLRENGLEDDAAWHSRYQWRLGTPESFAEIDRHKAAEQVVRTLTPSWSRWTDDLTAAELEQIAEILKGARARRRGQP